MNNLDQIPELTSIETIDPHELAIADTIALHTEEVSTKLYATIAQVPMTVEQAELLHRVQEYAEVYETEADIVNSQIEAGTTPDVSRLNSALLNFHAVADEYNVIIEAQQTTLQNDSWKSDTDQMKEVNLAA